MYTPARHHPSFSSSLLDQIYRSIDEPDHKQSMVNKEFTTKKQSSSSPDSSNSGGFSSSEAESFSGVSSRPKPIRTGTSEYITKSNQMYGFEDLKSKQKDEIKLVKTKSRAMKMYTDLKKMKQPISPGGRLTAFLNSIFTTGNSKNTKQKHSTCSSASSFTRSCLSKTPSSRGKLGDNKQRSVRFVPMYGDELNLHAFKFVKNPGNEEIRAQKLSSDETTRNYEKKVECEFDFIKVQNEIDLNYEDDAASNTSSDLFELENFSAIGMESYGDELPVFETTQLNKQFSNW